MANPNPLRPAPGISIQDAAALLRQDWEEYKAAPEYDPARKNRIQLDKGFRLKQLHRHARDCAWCVLHSHGDQGVRDLFDLAIKGIEDEKLDLALEQAFAYVGGWMP